MTAIQGCLKGLDLLDRYSTNRNDLISDFYAPCLNSAHGYDRAVGYFRSSILLLASRAVADFALRGGLLRLVCSPELREEDITGLERGYELHAMIGDTLLRFLETALQDPAGRPLVEFLATLVAVGCLDVRIAFRVGMQGIFHDKVGVFRDEDGHSISFTGSSNETFAAWDTRGNHESFDVFRSWTSESSRVAQHIEYFESLWTGHEPGVETIPFPDVARERLVALSNADGIEAAFERVIHGHRQTKKTLMPHQIAALDDWRLQGKRGILDHATGSGKTFTALEAARDWLKSGKPVLVLVPSELLLKQWYREVRSELDDIEPKVLLVGAGNAKWREERILEGFSEPEGEKRVTIATLQTANAEDFLGRLRSGQHLLLIADEVHHAGASKFSRVLTIDSGARLGLSATWRRYGDPIGTSRIIDYFENILEPPFTIKDAVAAGRLCPYVYRIHPVALTEDERDKWRALTDEIKREIARSRRDDLDNPILSDYAKILLIRRADIAKGAINKGELALEVMQQRFREGQRWLVYCDDQIQLRTVMTMLKSAKMPCQEYHSAMLGDQPAALDYFQTVGGILVAIQCLDEGIDIPAVDAALILASSRNPREFIQRRGRILRVAPGKHFAEINDALVLPVEDSPEPEEIALLRGELSRAAQFAEGAVNDTVKFQIRRIAREMGVSLGGVATQSGVESEEEKEE